MSQNASLNNNADTVPPLPSANKPSFLDIANSSATDLFQSPTKPPRKNPSKTPAYTTGGPPPKPPKPPKYATKKILTKENSNQLPIKTQKAPKFEKTPMTTTSQNSKGFVRLIKPTGCEQCKDSDNRNCTLCEHKGRTKTATTHCLDCCNYCAHCDRKGHQIYNPDGSFQCFLLQTCEICGKSGHNEDRCRRHWCQTCRTDGKGDNFVGHTTERCRKNHKCNVCGVFGHYDGRCRCDKCGKTGHTVNQCDRDTLCINCNSLGHSIDRCRACVKCGFYTPKSQEHRCRRQFNEKTWRVECTGCGGLGTGKCPCWAYH